MKLETNRTVMLPPPPTVRVLWWAAIRTTDGSKFESGHVQIGITFQLTGGLFKRPIINQLIWHDLFYAISPLMKVGE